MKIILERKHVTKRNLLLTPGPTKIPANICAELGKPIIHHRTPQFQEKLKEAVSGVQFVLRTKNDVYFLASSGTGAMEAAVINLLSPGEKAICVEGGKFGERWTELCQAYGVEAKVIKVEWGKAVKPDEINAVLGSDSAVKAVFVTHCETSTGVTTDVEAIARVVSKTKAVLVVDAVSSLGVIDLKMDGWGVDVVASGSHKGLMLPPGLAFLAVSEKAKNLIAQSNSPRYYFDLRKSQIAAEKTDTPFTPAISIIVALNESLRMIKDEGLENLFARCERLAKGTRAGALALGLTLFPDEDCISNVLTAINLPENIDGNKLVKVMRDTHGISIAGGQGNLKGKIVRIAHMGCVDEEDIITGFSYLEKVLKEFGHQFDDGAGVEAAKNVFQDK